MFFIDSNIFLELELGGEEADDCEGLLRKIYRGILEVVTTDFHIDSIVIIMENYGKGTAELRTFLSTLTTYKGLQIYFLFLSDRIGALNIMEAFGLDFDDSLAVQAMKGLKVTEIISFDRHFDKVPGIERVEPKQIL